MKKLQSSYKAGDKVLQIIDFKGNNCKDLEGHLRSFGPYKKRIKKYSSLDRDYLLNLKTDTNAPNRNPGAFAKSNNKPKQPTAIH